MHVRLASLVLWGSLAAACGDSGDDAAGGNGPAGGKGPEGGSTSGGGDAGGTGGGGGGGGTSHAPDCYAEEAALNPPGNATLVGLGLCTSSQITEYLAACFGAAASEETCMVFTENTLNDGCHDCVNAVDTNGNSAGSTPVINAFQTPDGVLAVPNVLACEAAAQGAPECGPPLSDVVFCYQTACSECSEDAFQECAQWSLDVEGICSTIGLPAACTSSVDFDIESPQCAGDSFEAVFTNIANYFCGPPR
jgi:hypothetical protein